MHSKPLAFLAAGALVIVLATGCSKGSDQSSTSSTTTTTATSAPAGTAATTAAAGAGSMAAAGDAAHGKTIFGQNCASCHGATGTEGGVGPSLKGEKARKNTAQTIAWIHNPQPPMPKLWPSPLNDKDVADVAAYVQSL